jgi:DNA-binding MarR family transcriptional regulator
MPERQAEVADLLNSAAIHLLRRAGEADRVAGLSPARLSALSVVVFRGPLTLGALAEAEGVRSATMSGIVKGLEQGGLIRRKPHGSDGRAILLKATAAGRRKLKRARKARIDAIASALEGAAESDLDILWKAGQLLEDRFALPGLRWQPVESDSR